MQFVGFLLIMNGVACAAWWIASGRSQLAIVPLCVVVICAGVFFMWSDRPKAETAPVVEPPRPHELEELTEESAKAKMLLTDLQDQTAVADWHLKQIEEHLRTIRQLPDGRTRLGNAVTGAPMKLTPKLEALQKIVAENPAEAYPLAKECVDIYESSRAAMEGVALAASDPSAETIGWLYTIAVSAAQRAGEHDEALQWARSAVETKPNAESHFLLVTALLNKERKDEAAALIERELKAGGAEAKKFRKFLDQYKIAY